MLHFGSVTSRPLRTLGAALFLWGCQSLADEAAPTPAPATDPTELRPGTYWDHQVPRFFVAGHVAVGGLNRLMLATGYGRPHWLWGGLQFEAMTTTEFGAVYGGVELELLLVNLAVGVRNTWSYSKVSPAVTSSYTEAMVYDDPTRPRAQYQSLDVGLWGYVPAGPTLGYWEATGSWLPFKPTDSAVFEEFLRFTLTQSTGGLLRLLWGLRLWNERITVGPMVELVGSPGRDAMLRVGAGLMFVATRHLSVKLNLAVPVLSPDHMGWFTQSFAVARLTWSWASGEPQWGWR